MVTKPAVDDAEQLDGLPADVETRPIARIPGYRAGRDGSVWSCWPRRGGSPGWHRMKVIVNSDGYAVVGLRRDGRQRHFKVAQLVLLAFVGPSPAGCIACHRFGDRSDDRLENLKYQTRAENAADRVARGTHAVGERSGKSKLTEAQAREILDRLRRGGCRHRELATEFGVTKNAIGQLWRGTTWPHLPRPWKKDALHAG